jgi:hypothetical protein
MTLIKFVRNYDDLSTDRGFQFEFYCDRCGTGYRTHFQASATGLVTEALDVASGLLGGVLGRAADVSERVHSAAWEQAHDKAFAAAVEEIKPNFIQCRRCTEWVCREMCWNAERGLCKECAPEVEVEYAAAQVEATIEQGREAIRETEYVSAEDKERLKEAVSRVRSASEDGEILHRVWRQNPSYGQILSRVWGGTAKRKVGGDLCPN